MTIKHKKKICLLTRDLVGPIKNGGIGTAFFHLANFLVSQKHEVTIIYTLGIHSEDTPISDWVDFYKKRGITLVLMPTDPQTESMASPYVKEAYNVYLYVKNTDFDVIYAHEWHGIAYYALQAKKLGLCLQDTEFWIGLHSPTLWHTLHNAEICSHYFQIEANFMEQKSVEMADRVISPSQYMVEWCVRQGWRFPKSTEIIQNLIEAKNTKSQLKTKSKKKRIEEIVFFGRLETRKGLKLFCKAIQLLASEGGPLPLITFLGKPSGTIDGKKTEDWITKELGNLVSFKVISHLGQAEAIEYLKKESRLAVIASLAENSPYTVLECIQHGIGFIATKVGGIPELVRDKHAQLFSPTPRALALQMKEALKNGVALSERALKEEETKRHWRILFEVDDKRRSRRKKPSLTPKVSVCVTHYNRPRMLERALASIEVQDYSNIEIIVVDDGSNDPDAIEYIASLKKDFSKKGWQVVRQENRYLGAARNSAARLAKGEFLLFMDDDNVAKPNEITAMVAAAEFSGADILTSAMEHFKEEWQLKPQIQRAIRVPVGASLSLAMFENPFGDANALIRRKIFNELGGFTEDYGIGFEDYEFFFRAVVSGVSLEVIPEPLFYYRVSDEGMLASTSRFQNYYRALRPLVKKYPELYSGILLSQGYHQTLHQAQKEYVALQSDAHEILRLKQEAESAIRKLSTENREIQKEYMNLERANRLVKSELLDIMQHVGPDVIKFSKRLNNRKITRVPFRLIVKIINWFYNQLASVRG